jgi:hypothetical protein
MDRSWLIILAVTLALAACDSSPPKTAPPVKAAVVADPADPYAGLDIIDGQRLRAGSLQYRGMRTILLDSLGPGAHWSPSKGAAFVVLEYDLTNLSDRQIVLADQAMPQLWESRDHLFRSDPKLTAALLDTYPQYDAAPSFIGPGMTVTRLALFEVPETYMRKFWLWTVDSRRYAEVPLELSRPEAEAVAKVADERRRAGGPEADFGREPRPGQDWTACGSAGCPNY